DALPIYGKEELAIEAIQWQGRFIEARMWEDLAAIDDAAEAIGSMFAKLAHMAASSGCRAIGPITAVALESSTTNERLRQVCADVYESWRNVIETQLLAAGIKPALAASLSLTILGALEGAATLTRTLHSPDPLLQTGEHLTQLLKAVQAQTG